MPIRKKPAEPKREVLSSVNSLNHHTPSGETGHVMVESLYIYHMSQIYPLEMKVRGERTNVQLVSEQISELPI